MALENIQCNYRIARQRSKTLEGLGYEGDDKKDGGWQGPEYPGLVP